jgi:hypothetical protein
MCATRTSVGIPPDVREASPAVASIASSAYSRAMKRRRIVLLAFVAVVTTVLATGADAATRAAAATSSSGVVPVVRCPTVFAIPSEARKPPASVVVLHDPSSTHGLVAYTNTELFLIGPAGMQCSGFLAVDGGTNLFVWPRGAGKPTQHSHSRALSLMVDPACASCRAEDGCPFFPKFAASLSFPCANGRPPEGEGVYALSADATTFEDPPGVAGDGWPSGGPDPANGIVGVNPSQDSSVYRATCTLPQSEHSICTVSLNDVFDRYGGNGSTSHSTTPTKPSAPARSSTLDVADFNGNRLAVTVAIFANPATPANPFARPPVGSRLVAIRETLNDLGPGAISSDVDGDTTLVGSNGQVYTPSFDDIAGCTNFDYGSFTLTPGESENGCVAFALPNSVAIQRVTFSLTDGAVDTAQWTAS